VHPGYYADWHTPGEKAAAESGAVAAPATGTPPAGPSGAQAEVK
jgi:hypothetical protein